MDISTDKLRAVWRSFYKKNLSPKYSLQQDIANLILLYNKKIVYQESFQHIDAVSKLMRIPPKVWLTWITSVIELSPDSSPLAINLSQRLKIFKKAYQKTIFKYYSKPEKFTITPDPCPGCGTKQFKNPIFKSTPVRPISILFCHNCGLGMRYPRSERSELSQIYEDNYFSGNTTDTGYYDYSSEKKWRIKKAENYLSQLEKILKINPQKTSVLDVGSGFGYFLVPLKKRGYSFLGIELSSDAVGIANKKFKTKTIKGELINLYKEKKLKKNSFDLITLWDVLEHFYDFNEELYIINKLLKPGRFVALRTNNIDSIEYKILGKHFHSIKNEHTFYYSEKTLARIFRKVNIKPLKIWTHTHLFLSFMTKAEINYINNQNKGGDIFFIGQKYA
jgi:2-polyprenyl-3-methyl-5-hydroxy-6-metoxy-1,4-benzoquinol methylase